MKFTSIAEAFNHYRTASVEEIETRAAEIRGIIQTDPNADMETLNMELSGLKQAKENAGSKQQGTQQGIQQRGQFKL